MKKEPKRWVTVAGKHFPIYEDENGNEVFGVGQEPSPIVEKEKNTLQYSFGGDYKVSDKMKEEVSKTVEDMQNEFSILSDPVEIKINKNMDDNGMGWKDYIELRGAALKKYMERGDEREIAGLTAHELTHTIQERLCDKKNIFGTDEREEYVKRVWDRAVSRFVADNIKYTEQQINKAIANAYGGGGHSHSGNIASEKMAVAMQALYSGYGHKKLGKYVAEELKKEM